MIDFLKKLGSAAVQYSNADGKLSFWQIGTLVTGIGLIGASVVLVPSLCGGTIAAFCIAKLPALAISGIQYMPSAAAGILALADFAARVWFNWGKPEGGKPADGVKKPADGVEKPADGEGDGEPA
ncbi:MAG: hypothetical protein LBC42_00510 [Puniceicoccales bacterium]|jgi:hypothetical protein|nr:hypothetical protein [Puniceicoccales bacterium]